MFMKQSQVEKIKQQYPTGTRIQLNHMDDPYAPVPPGTEGVVSMVDDAGQLHMKWDNGRSLALIPGHDSFMVIAPKLTTLKLYMPLTVNACERNYYGDLEDELIELDDHEVLSHADAILAAITQERSHEKAERGLMDYYRNNDSVNQKVQSYVFTVESHHGRLMGVAECRILGELSSEELETLKENIIGQAADGFGEGFEQHEIQHDGGMITEKGYVVHSGEIAQIYKSGDAAAQVKPNYTVMLEVCKGYFNDSTYDANLSEFPMLPADDGILDRAIAQVEAASIEECSIRAVDCIVPKLSEMISDALYATEGDCYGAVNELATQLQRLEQSGKLYTYKAMVEAAPQDITLEEAIDLSRQVDWFSVTKEATSPAAYAKDALSKYCIDQAEELFASTNLWQYGEKLIAENGISISEYGALCSLDGQTVEQRLCRTGQGMAMKMN